MSDNTPPDNQPPGEVLETWCGDISIVTHQAAILNDNQSPWDFEATHKDSGVSGHILPENQPPAWSSGMYFVGMHKCSFLL